VEEETVDLMEDRKHGKREGAQGPRDFVYHGSKGMMEHSCSVHCSQETESKKRTGDQV
jgi:hypothetical protein